MLLGLLCFFPDFLLPFFVELFIFFFEWVRCLLLGDGELLYDSSFVPESTSSKPSLLLTEPGSGGEAEGVEATLGREAGVLLDARLRASMRSTNELIWTRNIGKLLGCVV